MRIYCDSSVKEACLVINGYLSILPYNERVTSNEGEYIAVLVALKTAKELDLEDNVEILTDSELVVKQLSGEYKCRATNLIPYNLVAKRLIEEIGAVVSWVSREENPAGKELE